MRAEVRSEQIDFYRAHGFVHVPGLLTADELDEFLTLPAYEHVVSPRDN